MEGNQMKMREALDDIVEIAKIALNVNSFGNNNNSELWKIIDKCKSALSTPPRQCDVGSAEEQAERMRKFCAKQKRNGIINCGYCPIKHQYQRDCTLAWAQMPYEAKEGGAK